MIGAAQQGQSDKATALANAIAPLIERHFRSVKLPATVEVMVEADREVVEAAKQVAAAVTNLQQVKFTRAEIRARAALERAAVELRTRLNGSKAHAR